MRTSIQPDDGQGASSWRISVWSTAAIVLMVPFVAMQLTDGMAWDLADFAVFGAMLLGALGAYEFAARTSGVAAAYRAGLAVALTTAFILVWMNLAVGLIGSEDNPANLMFGGVLAVALIGAAMARLRPRGMARAMAATALAQASAGGMALFAGWGDSGANWPQGIVVLTGCFAALWLGSAWLFRKAARKQRSATKAAKL